MKIEIVAVHPTTVVVAGEGRQFELPLTAFPHQPEAHQHWTITLEHQPSETERLGHLNQYLARD